jgi:hypothetical protein
MCDSGTLSVEAYVMTNPHTLPNGVWDPRRQTISMIMVRPAGGCRTDRAAPYAGSLGTPGRRRIIAWRMVKTFIRQVIERQRT